jgi:hypothetical protein
MGKALGLAAGATAVLTADSALMVPADDGPGAGVAAVAGAAAGVTPIPSVW